MSLRRIRPLTDFAVVNAKPKSEGYEISDGGQRGLRLAVQPSGAKSWVVRFRHPVSGKSRKMTLPAGISLAAARKLASDAMFGLAQGIDPIDAKREQKKADAAAVEGTVRAVGQMFLDIGAPARSRDVYERVLDRVFDHLGDRQVTDLKRSEIVAMLDKIERKARSEGKRKAGGPRAADLTLAVLRSMLRWYQKRSDTFVSPIIPGMARVKPADHVRDRSLTDAEIKSVWEAAGDERIGTYGQAIRLMILTGARRSEAAGLKRSEIETVRDNGTDIDIWRLPASRSKNKREIIRPLSKAALDIINDTPIIGDDSEGFVFTLNGVRPLSMNYQDRKNLLDKIAKVQNWVLHDLRRVFRSLLSRCRVPFEIAERLLGHSQPVLVRTYDQHSHLPAMLEAVEKVAAEVERIVSGGEGRAHLRRIG
jgi:integrase